MNTIHVTIALPLWRVGYVACILAWGGAGFLKGVAIDEP